MTAIVQYWHSQDPPAEVRELTASFRELNPDLQHRVFDESEAEAFIAAHFSSRELAAFRACAVPAMQADYFRYCAVLALGGFYADAGFACRRPLASLLDLVEDGILFRQGAQVINGFFAFAAPGHPLLQLTLEVATANIEGRVAETVNKVTGPFIFTILAAIDRADSLEQARRRVAGGGMEPLVNGMLDAIGERERLTRAFDQVRIEPIELAREWIARPSTARTYKQAETAWVGWHRRKGSIFR
jgi:mannosyltransferase OCH1-like enzyme